MKQPFHSIRNQYTIGSLDEHQVDRNPLIQMDLWMSDAIAVGVLEPTAMVLSTADEDGKPSSRVVLMKGLDDSGISFFSNYESRKGQEIEVNPRGSLLLFWPVIERQIRIEGIIVKVSEEESNAYFASRPEASRISAAISPQSREIPNREWLKERQMAEDGRRTNESGHHSQVIGRPSYWGGYRLIPNYFEFWQGREDRLHDRIAFSKEAEEWRIFRLAP